MQTVRNTICLDFVEAQSDSDVYLMNAIVHRLERRSHPLLCGPLDHTQRVCCNLALRGNQGANERRFCLRKSFKVKVVHSAVSRQVVMMLRC